MPKTGTLTKAHLIDAVAAANGFTHRNAHETVETVLELIKEAFELGEDVLISGFGKFSVKEKAVRRGRNPATGEDMLLPARRVVAFHTSAKLREKINR
jgi:integration host factor subunit alpha